MPPSEDSAENVALMALIGRQYTACPFYGSRRITTWLKSRGHEVNRKRVQRLLRVMGLGALYPKPNRSRAGRDHRVNPDLLRDVPITWVDQVWSADITYVPLPTGFVYLVVTIDWFSRAVVVWRLSNTLDGAFCRDRLDEALASGTPEVLKTDQTGGSSRPPGGSSGAKVSMDGRGRCLDNVFVERLRRSVKHEDVYLRGYESVAEVSRGLRVYFRFYNDERLHQSLGYRTPAQVDREGQWRKEEELAKEELTFPGFWFRHWGLPHCTFREVLDATA